MATDLTMLPVRGQSVGELHGYFRQARKALDTRGHVGFSGKDVAQSTCTLYATRLIRAQAATVDDILLKIEAAEWLGDTPSQTLAVIRDDLVRLKAAKP
jgi:hypothetical protein